MSGQLHDAFNTTQHAPMAAQTDQFRARCRKDATHLWGGGGDADFHDVGLKEEVGALLDADQIVCTMVF